MYMLLGTLIALGVLVTFHEFGHFWVARRCGIRVLRFSVGFGMPLLRWHDRHGTEFVIAAIPLGGYVKMLDEREGEVPAAELDRAFNRKPVRQRMAVVAAGPLANFLLAALLFWLVAMLGSTQIRPVLGELPAGSPAALAGLQPGSELLAVDGEPVHGWRGVAMQLLRRVGSTGELSLQVSLPDSSLQQEYRIALQDWLRGVEDPEPLTALGLKPWQPPVEPHIGQLDGQGPAASAGLQVGDRLLSLAGRELASWTELIEEVRRHPAQTVEVRLLRQGQELRLQVLLGERSGQGYLGAGAWPTSMLREISHGPLDAIWVGLEQTWSTSVMTLESILKMLQGQLSVKNLSGPITIAKVAGASAQSGLGDFFNFLAYLSISLGVLNLLPIPVLDGGHLLFYLLEWARGRPLPERLQAIGMQVGVSLVLGLMLLALINDIGRL